MVYVAQPGALTAAMNRLLVKEQLRADMRSRAFRNAAERTKEHALDALWAAPLC